MAWENQDISEKIPKINQKIPQWLVNQELAKKGKKAYVSGNFYRLEKSE